MSDSPFSITIASNDEVPPDIKAYTIGTDKESTGFTCQACGVPIHYGGRGRHPKFCDEHKPKKAASSGRTSGGVPVDVLIDQIQTLYVAMATGATFTPYALDGMVIAENSEKLAESWRPLILRDPKIRKFWEKVCTGGGWGTVVFAHGLVAMQIAKMHGLAIPGITPTPSPSVKPEGDSV